VLQNDIYTNYKCTPPPKSALVLSRFICPAREDHIRKYSVQRVFMINETPELYAEKTLPWIESLDPKKYVARFA
jgi:m7GpppX diphosphatase